VYEEIMRILPDRISRSVSHYASEPQALGPINVWGQGMSLGMKFRFSRRRIMQAFGGAALASSAPRPAAAVDNWPLEEAPGTPKICLGIGHIDERTMREMKQLGVNYVIPGWSGYSGRERMLRGGPRIPWQESELRSLVDALTSGGLTVANLMITGFPNAIYGRPGRDEEINKVQASIRVAGRVGLSVVEYNFYAHRIVEGYYEETGRAGAGYTAFDYDKVKDLPPLPNEGAHSLDEMWNNVTYFLKAVVPVAKESNVRLALHPNDPPVPISRGSGQIMGTVEGWKKLVDIMPSPYNGITFDCGVAREMGHDPVEVCRYFMQKDCINHVHYRNVRVRKPYEKYTEVFIDEGQVDMFAVMRELVKLKYPRFIFPEHQRALEADKDESSTTSSGFKSQYPGGGSYAGYAYNVGYARAMLQAAMES
jgi:mannonate dehydratase